MGMLSLDIRKALFPIMALPFPGFDEMEFRSQVLGLTTYTIEHTHSPYSYAWP